MSNLYVLSQSENEKLLEPYEAFQVGSRRLRKLLMYDAEGRLIGMPSYSYYVDGFCTSPRYLWLLYSTTAFCIKGRNLPGDLLTLFVDDRLRVLFCFNPSRYHAPAADAVLIETITRHSLKEFAANQNEQA